MMNNTAKNLDQDLKELVIAEELRNLRVVVDHLSQTTTRLERDNLRLSRRVTELEEALSAVTKSVLGQLRVLDRSIQNVREERRAQERFHPTVLNS